MSTKGFKTRAFFTRIVLPSLLTIGMFIIALYFVLLPEFEDVILGRKRNMIRELTYSAWSILNEYEKSEKDSLMTREQAQREAAKRIEFLRYGEEGKDYFWITDMHPRMIMHPYRKDLNGTDLTNFKDPNGKKLFVEFVETVKTSDEGFVDYMWQWKDDSTRIVPKLSYVRVFKPWGWIIGTGIYVEDVKVEIKKLEYRVLNISMIITILIFALLATITFQSFRIEKRRFKAEEELKKSRERYKMLVDSATEGTLMVSGGNIIFSNRIIQDMLGYSQEELLSTYILKLLPDDEKSGTDSIRLFKDVSEGLDRVTKFESKLLGKDGNIVNTELSISSIILGKEKAYIIKVKEISSEKQEFLLNRNKFKNLTDNIKIGVFRTTIDRKGHFVEANPAAIEMLGFQTEKELFTIHIIDLFHDRQDRHDFMDELMKKYSVKNKIIRIKKRDATVTTIAVSAVLVIDEEGNPLFCDGILEDITEQKQKEEQQETMIAEL
ncbi:MAG: cache domain-containing protein, partial [Bacteroidota bacterium]